jgi:23S rRNA (guanosine2251-2'-O)-methyltransferase
MKAGADSPRDVELLAGPHAVYEAIRAGRRRIYRLRIHREERGSLVTAILGLAEERRLRIEVCGRGELDRLAPAAAHQGVIAEAGPFAYAEAEGVAGGVLGTTPPGWMLILDGIQDPQNLGAIVRTAEAAGARGLVLPRDRAAGISPAAVRASAGAAEHLPVARVTNLASFLETIKARGIWVVGAAAAEGRSLFSADLGGPLALVIGSEGRGMRSLTRRHCDFLVQIPMGGRVASLNASAAAAICMYEIVRQRQPGGRDKGSG